MDPASFAAALMACGRGYGVRSRRRPRTPVIGVGPLQGLADPHRARIGDERDEPGMPGAIAVSNRSASFLRWCNCRSLPPAAPAAPSTAALPRMDGGKITPSTTPPTTPHLSPDLVL